MHDVLAQHTELEVGNVVDDSNQCPLAQPPQYSVLRYESLPELEASRTGGIRAGASLRPSPNL